MIPARPILPALALATLPSVAALIAGSVLAPVAVPTAIRVAAPAAAALVAALAVCGRALVVTHRQATATAARATAADARIAELTRNASQLRHDLRGILSPALLTADRLAMSADPAARRAGEAMISTVERAEQRLRPDPTGPAS